MDLGRLEPYLLPGEAEREPQFQDELQRLSRKGLSLLGWVEIAVAAFMLITQAMMAADRAVFSGRIWQAAFVSSAGALTIAIATSPWGRRYARLAAVLSAWLAAAVLIWSSLLLTPGMAQDDHYILGEITSVLLATVALVPLLPLQTFALGLSIALFYLFSSQIDLHSWDPSHQVFILMLTLLSTGLSALIYDQRRSTHSAHSEALRMTADLNAAQSRAMLAETAVAVGRLAASLTHELNNPLGALNSAVDTMLTIAEKQAAATPGEQARFARMQAELHHSVRQAAERLSQVVARLQRFVELENDEKRPADINELIRDAAILFEPQLDGNIRLEFDLQPLPKLSCNPQQISAAIGSLMSNALNAIDGEGRVKIATAQTGSGIEVTVEDTGRGMSDDEVETLFDPGFRVIDGRVSAGNWSLFTSRQIVHEHGGDISVDSRPGAGTTMRISLPCA